MSQSLFANFNYPAHYRLGAGRIRELSELCMARGVRAPLVCTDAGVRALPWFSRVVAELTAAGLSPTIFSEVKENPRGGDVESGVSIYKKGACDGVVLLGGGSAMDVGKCIALMVGNDGSVFDYEDVGNNWTRVKSDKIPPMIAVPTTSGTGSEVGRASVIVNEICEKKIIFHPKMQPEDVIADPELTYDLPPALTAYTGIDAYVHCFEAWCAKGYHPMADGIALEGMRLIKEALPVAVRDGRNVEARTHMILASSMGATAFQKGLGIVHALSHALGGKLNVHHGLANAIFLPYCMEFNRSAIEERCEILAKHLNLKATFDDLLLWTLKLREELRVPHTLEVVEGLSQRSIKELAPLAHADPALSGNPKESTVSDMGAIMLAALSGELKSA